MTEETQQERLEPIKAEIYKCPIERCGFTTEDYDKAVEHANEPVDKPLPKGLVYITNFDGLPQDICIVSDEGKIEQRSIPNVETHTCTHLSMYFHNSLGYKIWGDVNSKIFKEWFGEGKVSSLSKEEFKDFKGKYTTCMAKMRELLIYRPSVKPEELIRTTPELEALLAQQVEQ